jgi:hypothetical protein
MRSPHTIGLECASPGIAIFQATFLDEERSQLSGGLEAAGATPFASGPRKDGQFCAAAGAAVSMTDSEKDTSRTRDAHLLPAVPGEAAIAKSSLRLTVNRAPFAGTGVEYTELPMLLSAITFSVRSAFSTVMSPSSSPR